MKSKELVLLGRQSALGAGGICILQLTGTGAQKLIQSFFTSPRGRSLSDLKDGEIVYGNIGDESGVIDEVLVVRRREDFWEINCHGGAAAVTAIEKRLAARGAVVDAGAVLDAGELAGTDAVMREAYRELVHARTARAAQMLADQVGGALSDELNKIAGGDDPKIKPLLDTWAYAEALLEPRRLLILGAPNVGKSTLLNRILGYERAITSPVPGTTVDRIGDFIEINGYPLAVTDSAGTTSESSRPFDPEMPPHLIIFVLDGSRAVTDDEVTLAAECGKAAPARIVVINKSDLPAACDAGQILEDGETGLSVSALTGEGVDGLLAAAGAALAPPLEPEPGSPVIFRKTWRDALSGAAGKARKLQSVIQGILEGSLK